LLDGRLSLTTPEGIRLQLTPAGPVPRAWAWLIDFSLWFAVAIALATQLLGSKLGNGIYGVVLFVTYWGYPIICEVYFGGRTLGKRALGIQVLRSDGLPVGWRESTLRNLMLVADFLPMMYLTGLLFMLFGRQFRRLGDIVAGTQVVYRDKPPQRTQGIAAPKMLPLPYPLMPDQQRALIDLFERESQLPAARLDELGTIAEPLTGLTERASLERLRGFAAGLTQ
jgi:uncharacterized RDD family membrane protein YckC